MEASKLETNQITLGPPQEKTAGNNKFISVPVKFSDKPFDIKITSKMKIFSHKNQDQITFSLGINLENENLDSFQKIQNKIQDLSEKLKTQVQKICPRLANFRKEDFQIIKSDQSDGLKLYSKLYSGKNKITAPFSVVADSFSRSKKSSDPHELVGVPF